MRLRSVLIATLAVVAPCAVRAQLRPPPIPRATHSWFGLEAGGVFVGSAAQHASGTAAVFRADAATRVAPYLVLAVDGMLFAEMHEERIVCPLASDGSFVDCGASRHVGPRDAITATLGRELGELHGTPRLVLGAGGGAYRLHDYPGWYLGVHAAAKVAIVDFGGWALTATLQPTLLPNIPDGHLWIVPLTFGVRAHSSDGYDTAGE